MGLLTWICYTFYLPQHFNNHQSVFHDSRSHWRQLSLELSGEFLTYKLKEELQMIDSPKNCAIARVGRGM